MAQQLVHFNGTKAEWAAKTNLADYAKSIVFINGKGDAKDMWVYTHGEYYNASEVDLSSVDAEVYAKLNDWIKGSNGVTVTKAADASTYTIAVTHVDSSTAAETADDSSIAGVGYVKNAVADLEAKIGKAVEDLDSSIRAAAGYAITGLDITDGKITAKTEAAFDASGAADAALAAAKTYTDSSINALNLTEVGEAGKFIATVKQENGKVSATATEFVGDITVDSSASVVAPTTAAVVDYVNEKLGTLAQALVWKGSFDSLEAAEASLGTDIKTGYVVKVGNKEYVYNADGGDNKWDELGDESMVGTAIAALDASVKTTNTVGKALIEVNETDGKLSGMKEVSIVNTIGIKAEDATFASVDTSVGNVTIDLVVTGKTKDGYTDAGLATDGYVQEKVADAKSTIIGNAGDASTVDTINGVRAYVDGKIQTETYKTVISDASFYHAEDVDSTGYGYDYKLHISAATANDASAGSTGNDASLATQGYADAAIAHALDWEEL